MKFLRVFTILSLALFPGPVMAAETAETSAPSRAEKEKSIVTGFQSAAVGALAHIIKSVLNLPSSPKISFDDISLSFADKKLSVKGLSVEAQLGKGTASLTADSFELSVNDLSDLFSNKTPEIKSLIVSGFSFLQTTGFAPPVSILGGVFLAKGVKKADDGSLFIKAFGLKDVYTDITFEGHVQNLHFALTKITDLKILPTNIEGMTFFNPGKATFSELTENGKPYGSIFSWLMSARMSKKRT